MKYFLSKWSLFVFFVILFGCTKKTATLSNKTSTHIPPERMVYIPGGDFIMGDFFSEDHERPAHPMHVEPFYMDKYETTNAEYKKCVDAGVCRLPLKLSSPTREFYFGNPVYDNFPVIYISWEDAKKYATWVGKRLPTEAEWEFAARSSDDRIYPWGSKFNKGNVNYNNIIGDTTEIGTYPNGVSPYGALDMAGNVEEWTSDWYLENAYRSLDINGHIKPGKGQKKVIRGGCWGDKPVDLRAALRFPMPKNHRSFMLGVRLVKSID